jgi:hypothetical protein
VCVCVCVCMGDGMCDAILWPRFLLHSYIFSPTFHSEKGNGPNLNALFNLNTNIQFRILSSEEQSDLSLTPVFLVSSS